jgi:hypothetical protein
VSALVHAAFMSVTLCVLLWARDGEAAGLASYEDQVLELVAQHQGEVLQRVRGDGADGQPLEVQIIRFGSEAAFDAYLRDGRREAMAQQRERCVERTELVRVDLVGEPTSREPSSR